MEDQTRAFTRRSTACNVTRTHLYYIPSQLTTFILTPLPKSVHPFWVVFDSNQQNSPTLNACLGKKLTEFIHPIAMFFLSIYPATSAALYSYLLTHSFNCLSSISVAFSLLTFSLLLRFLAAKGVVCLCTHNVSSVLLQVNFCTLTRTTLQITPMECTFFTFLLLNFNLHRLLRMQVLDKKPLKFRPPLRRVRAPMAIPLGSKFSNANHLSDSVYPSIGYLIYKKTSDLTIRVFQYFVFLRLPTCLRVHAFGTCSPVYYNSAFDMFWFH